jgi:integrase
MKRRAAGDGSIYKVTNSRGATFYRGSLSLGFDPGTGKRLRKTVTRQTRPKVVAELDRLKRERDAPKPAVNMQPFGTYIDEWIEGHAHAIRESTLTRYREQARMLSAVLRAKPLIQVRAGDLEALYHQLIRRYAPNTVLHLHRMLHTALRRAERDELLLRNPAANAEPPRVPKSRLRPFAPEQIQALLYAAHGDRFESAYVLALTTGMREGELLGLRWQDIDWQAGTVTVRGQLRRKRGVGLQFSETKTDTVHTVKLAPSVLELLRQRQTAQAKDRQRAGSAWMASDYIFTLATGSPVQRWTFIRNAWLPLLERAALPRLGFHTATRHGAATYLVSQGVHPKIIASILGHSTATLSMDLYAHEQTGGQDEAAEAMERLVQTGRNGNSLTSVAATVAHRSDGVASE